MLDLRPTPSGVELIVEEAEEEEEVVAADGVEEVRVVCHCLSDRVSEY
jgi:hypothetical protein